MQIPFFKSKNQEVDMKDEIIWDNDKKGVFYVKSAYFLGLKIANSNVASSSEGIASKSMLLSLWKSEG